VGVVALLEVVKVKHEQRQREIRVAAPIDLVFEKAPQETPVVQAGEFVFEDQARRIFPNSLEEIDELAMLRVHGVQLELRPRSPSQAQSRRATAVIMLGGGRDLGGCACPVPYRNSSYEMVRLSEGLW
jgi:hypothetical protein